MLKRKIDFISQKTKTEIQEEIRNIVRTGKFDPSHTPFELRKFFFSEFLSRNFEVQLEEGQGYNQVTIVGKVSLIIEVSIWVALLASLIGLINLTLLNGNVELIDIVMPWVWIVTQSCIFYFPLKGEINFIRSKLT